MGGAGNTLPLLRREWKRSFSSVRVSHTRGPAGDSPGAPPNPEERRFGALDAPLVNASGLGCGQQAGTSGASLHPSPLGSQLLQTQLQSLSQEPSPRATASHRLSRHRCHHCHRLPDVWAPRKLGLRHLCARPWNICLKDEQKQTLNPD